MPLMTKNACVTAFGLRIRSELPFPELPAAADAFDGEELSIRLLPLADEWKQMTASSRRIVAAETGLLLHIPGLALFAVREGRVIEVSPLAGADLDKVRLYLLGTCMGAVLMQRGILPLHGSAVALDGKAYAIVGESGMGKSTLASALMERGHALASDDVIAVHFDAAGMPLVTPSYPQQKLWQESLEAFGRPSEGLKPLFERETKFAVPVGDRYASRSLPFGGIFELNKKAVSKPTLAPVNGLARMNLLFQHTYRNLFLKRLNKLDWHFHLTAKLAEAIPLYRMIRPEIGFTAYELADLLENEIRKEGNR